MATETLGRRARTALSRVRFPGRGPLVRALWRGYERFGVARRGGSEAPGPAPDGLPLPPARVMAMTTRPPTAEFFLRSGAADFELMRGMLARTGAEPGSVLDFGCGCGRVARWWLSSTDAGVHGCDLNRALVRWCEDNLPALEVAQTGLKPPLPYADGSFEFVYAISVITHLSGELQRAWLDELARVVLPGGHLLVTAMGELYLDRLSAEEADAFRAGRPVERFGDASGSNACSAYHPVPYLTGLLAEHGLEVVEVLEATDPASPPTQGQDAYLARRRSA